MARRYLSTFLAIAALMFSSCLSVYAEVNAGVSVANQEPGIISVKTFSSYTDDSNNVPDSYFSSSGNNTVYVQVKANDNNGYLDIRQNGYVKVKIVLWDTNTETVFSRFGSSYQPATFEAGNENQTIYTYSFLMDPSDAARLGNELPPLYYRVKAQVSDGTAFTTSNTSAQQNADYAYNGTHYQPPPEPYTPPTTRPPFPVTFDLSITIPENKRVVDAGDSFYATVAVTKISPPGQVDVYMTYKIIDPENRTVAYLAEVVAMNYSVYRVPVLYLPTDAESGQYIFRAGVSYDGVNLWSEAAFEVRGSPATTTTIPGNATTTTHGATTTTRPLATTTTHEPTTTTTIKHGGWDIGGGIIIPEIPVLIPEETKKSEVSIDKYPIEVYGFKGESKPVMTVIENTGDTELEDVTVYIGGPTTMETIVPEKIDVMDIGSRKVFIMNIKIPEELKAGEYVMVLKAITMQATDERSIKLIVLEKPDAPEIEVKSRIDELNKLADAVWAETVKLGISEEDKNVAEVFTSLKNAKDILEQAKEDWKNKKYLKSQEALKNVRDEIEASVIKLATINSERKKETKEIRSEKEITIYMMSPIFWAIAITAIIVTILLIHERFKSSKPVEKLDELYDLWRTKDLILGRTGGSGNEGRMKEAGDPPQPPKP